MPTRAPKVCERCGTIDCQTHTTTANQLAYGELMKLRRQNDPYVANYKMKRWQMMRRRLIAANPVCVECTLALATDLDHIINAKTWVGDGNNFWDESNLQPLCHSCHSRKTATEVGFAGAHQ